MHFDFDKDQEFYAMRDEFCVSKPKGFYSDKIVRQNKMYGVSLERGRGIEREREGHKMIGIHNHGGYSQ